MAEVRQKGGILQPVIVRTVCATGKLTLSPTVLLTTDYPVDGILGARVAGIESTATIVDDGEVVISGHLEVNVWYSYKQGSQTGVAIQILPYEHRVQPVQVEGIQRLGVKEEVLLTVDEQPSVVDHFVRTGEKENVGVSVRTKLTVDIVGVSKVWIMIYPPPGDTPANASAIELPEPTGESFAFLERDDSGLILPERK